jgi:hypothetical protein
MRDLARALPEQLQNGRDTLGALLFGLSVSVPMPLTGDFLKASEALNHKLLEVQCSGVNNLTYALEKAYESFAVESHGNARNAIVLVTGQGPTMITANWPVRIKPDHRAWIPRPLQSPPAVQLAVSGCPDSKGRTSADKDWAVDGSMPDLRGALWIVRDQAGGIPRGPLAVPDATDPTSPYEAVLSRDKPEPTCAFASSLANIEMDVAFIPETDAEGVAMAGSRPLERFSDGPYQGRIRPDVAQNWRNAMLNVFDNAVRRLREDSAVKAQIFVVSMFPVSIPEELATLEGVVLIPVFAPEQLPGALGRIWETLGRGKRL